MEIKYLCAYCSQYNTTWFYLWEFETMSGVLTLSGDVGALKAEILPYTLRERLSTVWKSEVADH